MAGGLASSPADIIRLARFILSNGKNTDGVQVVDSNLMQELWKDQTNKAPVIAAPYPINPPYNNPYNADTIRYGIGTWLDIYNPIENYQEQISGGGAFGSIMWINRCNNTCGVVFTYSSYSKVWETSFQIVDEFNKIYPNECSHSRVNESQFEKNITFPNPASEYIEISQSSEGFEPSEGLEIKIYNDMGELVLSDVLHLGDVGHVNRVDISDLPIGLYFIKIGDKYGKFIKE